MLHFSRPFLTSTIFSDKESLDEFKVREMNDGINKLLREKHHWERRILELGGPSYPVRLNLFFCGPEHSYQFLTLPTRWPTFRS